MSDDQNNYKKNTESAIIKMEVKFVQMIMCKEQLPVYQNEKYLQNNNK